MDNAQTVIQLDRHKHQTLRYYEAMQGSMRDKLFFVDKLPADVTVIADYGCGDGTLLSMVNHTHQTIGYDRSAAAIELAFQGNPDACWTAHLGMFAAHIDTFRKKGHKVCLVLSSVVHEVLSEGTSFHSFWRTIRALDCDYIAIRDMGVEHEAYYTPVLAPTERALMRSDKLTQWLLYGCETVGSLSNRAEMLHGLLKYRYANWEKEYAENYLSLSAEQWLHLTIIGSGYQLRHFDHYALDFNVRTWEADFGVTIKDPTHVNILLKKV